MTGPAADTPRLYFLSDVHLGVGSPTVEARKQELLLQLLHDMRNDASGLYIVGDLFDFWYEYAHVVPRGMHTVLAALESLARAVPIVYLAGNHDFAIGSTFTDMGIRVERDDVSFDHAGARFWVHHGDGLALRDGGYRALKRVLRNPLSQWGFRWLHPDVGFGLARAFSHGSRDYTSSKDFGEHDGMLLEAGRRIASGADVVVMGHRHRPSLTPVGSGLYVNLGDWITHFTYAVHDTDGMHLMTMKNGHPAPFQETA